MEQIDIDYFIKLIKKDTDNILNLSINLKNKPEDLIDLSEELSIFLTNFLNKKMYKLANEIKNK